MNQKSRRRSKRSKRIKGCKPGATFGTAASVRARYDDISDMTLWRWLQDEELSFPKPILIKGRRYWRWSNLDAWDAAQVTSSTDLS